MTDGSPLSVGAYTVSGELIDQFGEATGKRQRPVDHRHSASRSMTDDAE